MAEAVSALLGAGGVCAVWADAETVNAIGNRKKKRRQQVRTRRMEVTENGPRDFNSN